MSGVERTRLQTWFLIVLVTAIFVRAGLWLVYPLAESNDTPTYRHLARSLTNKGFESYNGTRTPGYPAFLALAGSDGRLYAIQLGLGVLTTLLIFYIAWRLSRCARFAGLLALAHTLNLGQLFFEDALLSEALATFLIFLVLAGLIYVLDCGSLLPRQRLAAGVQILIGLAAAILALTRPLFAFVPFWGAFFLVFFSCARQGRRAAPWKIRWSAAIFVSLPALVALGIWINFIHVQFNIWGMDSIGGYHLVNHTSSFFELAPDEYAPIRETFLKFRAQRLAESGSPVNTIWDAIPTLMKQEKLNYYALGRRMGEISSRLIAEHPDLYAKNLALGWSWFWRVGVFWLPQSISNSLLRQILTVLMLAERALLFGINLLFLGGSLALPWPKIRAQFGMNIFLWFAASAVWVTSILQTLAEHGDNPRFLAPMQSLVVLIVAWWLVSLVESRKSKVEYKRSQA
jgi:hypothetical protein